MAAVTGVGKCRADVQQPALIEIADTVTVIRDGTHVATRPMGELSVDQIITLMVGREIKNLFPREEHAIGEVIFEARNVTCHDVDNPARKRVDNISFSLRRGEILGVAGLVGAGRTEVARCLFGADAFTSGVFELDGVPYQPRDPLYALDQGVALGRVLPMVMLGGLTAIIISGCLNQLGKRYPHLTGEGQLMPNRANADATVSQPAFSGKADVTTIASGALLAVLLYMLGMLGHKLIGLPAPVGMLFMAVLVKLCNGASPRLLEGSQVVYKFFQTSVTYPILFAVGVAITPWHELMAAFTLTNLLVIISTVSALVATGFFVGKKIGMHPIDVAIVSCCQSGQGGTGDVAILTAGNRMSLMPFAQIATRIGGAINVSISLLILGNFLV